MPMVGAKAKPGMNSATAGTSGAIAERLARVRERRAHGKPSVPSTLEEECATNPFLRWDAAPVIAKALTLGASSDSPVDVFAALRRAKDTF